MNKKIPYTLLLKSGFVFLLLASLLILTRVLDLSETLTASWIDSHIKDQGLNGILLYCLLTACTTACGAPRQLLSFLGGYAFGAEFGTLWATIGTTFGCILGFSLARLGSAKRNKPLLDGKLSTHIQNIKRFLALSPLRMALVIRLLPVGNNALTNIMAGLSRVPALAFFCGSFLGYLPQNLVFAILGSGINIEPIWRFVLSASLLATATALGLQLYRKHANGKNGETH